MVSITATSEHRFCYPTEWYLPAITCLAIILSPQQYKHDHRRVDRDKGKERKTRHQAHAVYADEKIMSNSFISRRSKALL
mmetsp:Transcript_25168/g.32019  ORF Transcript_25168/g.32019 Transcript_25168/m.32019 type:complete len:80 (-) Transcript_25168:1302-1541(-)